MALASRRVMKTRMSLCVLGFASLVAASSSSCGDDEPLPRLTSEECVARGGRPIADPGDGSTHRDGCPWGDVKIASLDVGIEGGICCVGPF
jgi:hypothetical protein